MSATYDRLLLQLAVGLSMFWLAVFDIPRGMDVAGPVDSIHMALVLLSEASSLASKVPCFGAIAGMLRYAIQVHGVRVPSSFRGPFSLIVAMIVRLGG